LAERSESSGEPSTTLCIGLVLLLTFVAYATAIGGGFVWDDDYYVTGNQTLRSLDGLRRIWLEPTSIPQYYPLVHTSFWLEYQLWQLNPLGYHLVNVALHALAAILVFLLLRRLSVPGALFAALLFAVHPVHVESVAWITERKNVLSAVFYLLALAAYLRFRPPEREAHGGDWGAWALAFLLFVCALLAKTVTCSLPAVLLLILYWKRGRLAWRDWLPLLPFFLIGLAMAATTGFLERVHVGAEGPEFELGLLERSLIAGRALWFYLGKLVWPHPLVFNYVRWEVDAAQWSQYLWPLLALAVLAVLWAGRRRLGRAPLVAVLFFAGTLLPALGFVNVYPHRYSFVADHFQYLASLGVLTLLAAGAARLLPRGLPGQLLRGAVLAILVLLCLRQGRVWANHETLWLDTVEKNPSSWVGFHNLGNLAVRRSDLDAADTYYRKTLELFPEHIPTLNDVGLILVQRGQTADALPYYQRALELDPEVFVTRSNLGLAHLALGEPGKAAEHLREAVRLLPGDARTHHQLAGALVAIGEPGPAEEHFREAIRLAPRMIVARVRLGELLAMQGKVAQAIEVFEAVLEIQPQNARAQERLADLREALE
jgi:tetratricopeptide (TPR) repeat protein